MPQAAGGPPPPLVAPPPPPPLSFQTTAMVDRLQGRPVPPVPAGGKLFGALPPQRIASVSLKLSAPASKRLFSSTRQQQQQQQQQQLEAMEPSHFGVLIQYSMYICILCGTM